MQSVSQYGASGWTDSVFALTSLGRESDLLSLLHIAFPILHAVALPTDLCFLMSAFHAAPLPVLRVTGRFAGQDLQLNWDRPMFWTPGVTLSYLVRRYDTRYVLLACVNR